jgi:hypothetical protein
MRAHTTLCLAALCLLGACNQPAVTLKAPAFQSSENTVRDWNDVAHEIATELAAHGLLPGLPPAPGQPTYPPKPIFVMVQAPNAAFIHEVAAELKADILARGGAVARVPTGATVVNLDVDFVKWSPRDKPPGLLGTTAAVLTTPGIVIGATGAMNTWTAADAAGATAAGLGVFIDGLIALTPLTNAEAVWRASVVTDDQVVMQIEKPLYIRDRDVPLYTATAHLVPVASWREESPALMPRPLRLAP